MNSKVYYHVYISSAVELMSKERMLELLNVCRTNNLKLGITGMLLHKDGNFMQVIEGPEMEVRNVLLKIYKDSRHHNIIQLIEGYSDERQFSDWEMGFHELNSPELSLLPGYSEFLNTPLEANEFKSNPNRCQRLLNNFKKVQR